MSDFRILLKLLTPVVEPAFMPRLDRLCHEARCRLDQDWHSDHELPLEWDSDRGYRASQMFWKESVSQRMQSVSFNFPDTIHNMELDKLNCGAARVSDKGEPQKGRPRRLSSYRAVKAPFVVFYGQGDGDQIADLLSLLDGIGREHARGFGAFEVLEVTPDDQSRWQVRPCRQELDPSTLPFDPIADRMILHDQSGPEPVWRPPFYLKEPINE